VGLSILGVGVIFYEGLGLEGASLIGDLLVLLAAMGFGAYTVLSMRVLGRYSPLAVATYPILFGGPLVLLVSVPFFTRLEWEGVGMGAWAAVVFSAIFATAFAFSAWQTGVSRIGANRVLVYQYLISITGVASGIVFFGEVLGLRSSSAGLSPSWACTSPGDNENPLRVVWLLDPFLILQRVGLRPYWGTMLA
jgi:drug/metabolite transporter (DMT)-like permease